jgi:hypothetical protein
MTTTIARFFFFNDVIRYVEVVDVKGHKQLVDDGFREEGLLVLYTRSAKPATGSVSE